VDGSPGPASGRRRVSVPASVRLLKQRWLNDTERGRHADNSSDTSQCTTPPPRHRPHRPLIVLQALDSLRRPSNSRIISDGLPSIANNHPLYDHGRLKFPCLSLSIHRNSSDPHHLVYHCNLVPTPGSPGRSSIYCLCYRYRYRSLHSNDNYISH